VVSHTKISVMTYPADRTGILDTTRDVVMIVEITVVIVVVTTVIQTTVAALVLGVE